MKNLRLTGPGVGVEKYDILTALATEGLASGGIRQISMLRLIALVTARYNWSADEVTIGQREMSQLWSVDERTAKRETKRLIEAKLLEIIRPGVRGRVASYRLCRDEIYQQTSTTWCKVGPDYDARMNTRKNGETLPDTKVVKVNFGNKMVELTSTTTWDKALQGIAVDQPGIYTAWFSTLNASEPDSEDILHIIAPSRFVADYVTTRFLALLENAMSKVCGRKIRCLICARDTD